MDPNKILDSYVASETLEKTTLVCGADSSSSLAGDSWKFTVEDKDGNATVYQPYYIVDGVGVDPVAGHAEVDTITWRADSSDDLRNTYFKLHDGSSTSETDYYVYFKTDSTGYDPGVGQSEVTEITCPADTAGSLDGKYWTLDAGSGQNKYVWYALTTSTVDPNPSSVGVAHGIRVPYTTGDSATAIASRTAKAIMEDVRGNDAYFSASASSAVVTVQALQVGNAANAADGDAGVSVSVTQAGVDALNVSGGALEDYTCLGYIDVVTNDTDTTVGTKANTMFNAAGWTAAAVSAIAGYQDVHATTTNGGTATGLSATSTYYFKVAANGGSATEYSITTGATATYTEVLALLNAATTGIATWTIPTTTALRCTSASTAAGSAIALTAGVSGTAGYQEFGLSGKTGGGDTSLSATTTYYIKVAVNGGTATEYSVTTAASCTYTQLIALLEAAIPGVAVSLTGGDIRVTSDSLVTGSAIALTAGVSGTAGYQELGLTGKTGASDTGLTAGKWYWKIAKDGGAAAEKSITVAGDATVAGVLALMNAATTAGTTFALNGGDVRCTSSLLTTGSAIALTAGTSGLPGYQELGLSTRTGESDTGLSATSTYYFKLQVDGGSNTEYSITTADDLDWETVMGLMNTAIVSTGATFGLSSGDIRCTSGSTATGSAIAIAAGVTGTPGYQAVNVGGAKTLASATGLANTTQYYFKLNIDGAGEAEYDITTATATTYADIIALMNAEITGATFSVSGGNLRCTSALTTTGSAIALAAGSTGTDLFATLTDYVSITAAVAWASQNMLASLTGYSACDAAVALTVRDLWTGWTSVSVEGAQAWASKDLLAALSATPDGAQAWSLMTMFANLTGYQHIETAVARVAAKTTLTHPTPGNCSNTADGNVGGVWAVSISGGEDPSGTSYTTIPISIAEDATDAQVAAATRTAIAAVDDLDYLIHETGATNEVIIQSHWAGAIDAAADVDTGWSFTRTTTGSATIEPNMGQNTSAADYVLKPDTDEVYYLRELVFCLSDSAISDGTKFGALTALTNGIKVEICNYAGTALYTLVPATKTTAALAALGPAVALGTTHLNVVYNMEDAFGGEVPVNGDTGQYLRVNVDDNLNGIDGFYMYVKGHIHNAF